MVLLLTVSASVTDQITEAFRDPAILAGIPLALLGAIFMSFGAQYQYRGVQKVEKLTGRSGGNGLDRNHLLNLLRRPSWLAGTIIAAVGGIFIFVTIAAFFATERPVTQAQLLVILGLLAVTIVIFAVLWLVFRKHGLALFYIVASGVLYGFVATLAKVVLSRIRDQNFDWLTLLCVVALLAAVAVGAYFVQTAYSLGPPDLVIAGLTVIDPIVAVVIGLVVLQEAETAPLWAFIGFGVAGALAVYGVISLARNHPQVISDSLELPFTRGSSSDESSADGSKSAS
jgi:hypothetical protein